jgi:hypothetical protein
MLNYNPFDHSVWQGVKIGDHASVTGRFYNSDFFVDSPQISATTVIDWISSAVNPLPSRTTLETI